MIRHLLLGLWGFGLLVSPLVAQEPTDEQIQQLRQFFERIQNQTFTLNITLQLKDSQETLHWDTSIDRITVLGREVMVQLTGEDSTVIEVGFTPFQRSGALVLQARTEITTMSKQDHSLKYSVGYTSQQIQLGQPVKFYPLGFEQDDASGGISTLNSEQLILEIIVSMEEFEVILNDETGLLLETEGAFGG